jgi:hypothetical protein
MQISVEEGGMMRGNVTISRHIAKGGGVMRADAKQRRWDRVNATTSWRIDERQRHDNRQCKAESVQQEVTQQSAGENERVSGGRRRRL